MKKAVAFIAKLASGKVASIAGEAVEPILAAAKKVRETGKLDGEAVTDGIVLASHRQGPVLKFRIRAAAESSADGESKSKKASSKGSSKSK